MWRPNCILDKPSARSRRYQGEPVQSFRTAEGWAAWLAAHHAEGGAIWIRYAKRDSGITSVTYAEALDAAICYGWIDGQVLSLDERYYLQRFTPRRPRSRWSKVNVGKAEALIAAGRMRPAGLSEVEAAVADGRWAAAYSSPRTATVPEDLQAALDAQPARRDAFLKLKSQERYAILYRLESAKRPETRSRQIERVLAALASGE